jgi:EAL domain-containing protein (putative c-di-GMP-specific phosphodiesterase class I)
LLEVACAWTTEVFAEGVETRAAFDSLLALGSKSSQGFFFAAPLPAESMAEVLASVKDKMSIAWWESREDKSAA